MKQIVETFLRIILLVVILYTTSFTAFAGNKGKQARAARKKAHTAAALNPPNLQDAPAPAKDDKTHPQLAPELKRKPKVAIVPAPPPGQIPTYVPPKR